MTSQQIPNQNAIATLETHISDVTVYTNQARVTRRGTVTLSGQERELAIAPLPLTLQTESVRATGSGTVAVRVLGVRTETVFTTEPTEQRTALLTQQIQQLEEQKRTIGEQVAARQLQLKFVEGLSEKTMGFFASGLAKQQVGLNETGKLLKFIGLNYTQLSSAIAQHEKQQRQLDKQLDVLWHQLRVLQTRRPLQSFSIIVAIEPSGSGEFELEVSYVVNQASWTPLYDLRVNTADNHINLSYLAEVSQNTGEDWSGIALTLSTAKPGLGTLPPKLSPWYINIFDPKSAMVPEFMTYRSRSVKAKNPGASNSVEFNERENIMLEDEYEETSLTTASAPAAIAAQTVTASVSRDGGVVSFDIGGNNNIPNGGTPHKVTIFNENYPSKPEYIAAPRLVSFAYLQAAIVNPLNGATLLAGKANIFRDNTFIGTTQLENVSPGQEFKINLGIDEGLKIERNLVERQVEKKLIGNQRRTSYAYRLMITNLQKVPTTLTLREQLPVSRDEQIKVRLTLTNPKLQLGEMGMLEWVIDLPSQAKQEVYYQFVVEHSPDLTVIDLDI